MRAQNHFSPELIAPCGMNCGICSGYLAYQSDVKSKGIKQTYCISCRVRHKNCAFLKKRCPHGLSTKIDYCYQCATFPCENLKKLDTRYREKYQMSMIENLKLLRDQGMEKLLQKQAKTWTCHKCGGIISCHNRICYSCEIDKLKTKIIDRYGKLAKN